MRHTPVRLTIIQNAKLVVAVTHVLVSNPTEGYGIFILLAGLAVCTAALCAMLRFRSTRRAMLARLCKHRLGFA